MSIDPLESPLHAGIAGVELPADEFDFGEGIVLRRTTAMFSRRSWLLLLRPRRAAITLRLGKR